MDFILRGEKRVTGMRRDMWKMRGIWFTAATPELACSHQIKLERDGLWRNTQLFSAVLTEIPSKSKEEKTG